jgi:hypothetical protein
MDIGRAGMDIGRAGVGRERRERRSGAEGWNVG